VYRYEKRDTKEPSEWEKEKKMIIIKKKKCT
jgi:signal recognition particle subunit SEC65